MESTFVKKLQGATDEDRKYFGVEPQASSRALLFELRFRSGRRLGFPYSYLTKLDFDPTGNIEIQVSDAVVTISGRNLKDIFTYLIQNRLTFIQEDPSGIDTEDGDVFVAELRVE
jgi:hypothetical protein